jgi:hypothetical protein
MFREYRTAHGRWTKPDPAGMSVVDPTNPQTWNRYAYVLNNPTAMVDLLGEDGCYDSDGNDVGVAQVNCYSAGGVWLGSGAYVVNGSVYISSVETDGNIGGPNGGSLYAYNVYAGSFTAEFGYLFQGTLLTVNPNIPNGTVSTGVGVGQGGNAPNNAPQPPKKPPYWSCVAKTTLADAAWGVVGTAVVAVAVPTVLFAVAGSSIGPEGTFAGGGLGFGVGVAIAPGAAVDSLVLGLPVGFVHGLIGCAF